MARFEGYLRRAGLLPDELAERVKAEALELMREGIAAAEAEAPADAALVFDRLVRRPAGVAGGRPGRAAEDPR